MAVDADERGAIVFLMDHMACQSLSYRVWCHSAGCEKLRPKGLDYVTTSVTCATPERPERRSNQGSRPGMSDRVPGDTRSSTSRTQTQTSHMPTAALAELIESR